MSETLSKAAYDNMLALIEDAVSVADDALAFAARKSKEAPLPSVTLTKVASVEQCRKAASAIVRTGVFREWTTESLTAHLRQSGEGGFIELLEKLASRAMFPLHVDTDLRGDLVEKPASTNSDPYQELPANTATWQRAWDEAGQELKR